MHFGNKLTFAIYSLFSVMGVWLGSDGYQVYEAGVSGSAIYSLTAFMLFFVGVGATVATIPLEEKQFLPIIRLLSNTMLLAGSAMCYAYMAGPFSYSGKVMSPWLIIPMFAVLAVICKALTLNAHHRKIAEEETSGEVQTS